MNQLKVVALLSDPMVKLPFVVTEPLFTAVVFAITPPDDATPSAYAARDASLYRQTLPREQPGRFDEYAGSATSVAIAPPLLELSGW
jgi:hypothetical protein